MEKQGADHIKKLAMSKGMLTLRQDGWRKIVDGVTTPTEVMNITVKDEYGEEEGSKAEEASSPAAGIQSPQPQVRTVTPEVLSAKDDYNSRVFPRVKGKVGIRYSIVRQDSKFPTRLITDGVDHSSITKDISAGGLRFVSGYTLPVGTILSLKIQLDKSERSVDCLAKVCRVEDDNLSAMFNLVVYYLDISSADRVKIGAFVKSIMEKQDKGGDSIS